RKGIDIQRLTVDLINIAKEAVIYSYAAKDSLLEKLHPEQASLLVRSFSSSQLLKYIDYLMETSARYRDATDGFACFEVCLLKMMDYEDSKPARPIEPAVRKTEAAVKPVEQPVMAEKKPEQLNEIQVEEKPAVEPVVEIKERRDLSDEEFYQILSISSKAVKEQCLPVWNQFCQETSENADLLRGSTLMAACDSNLIVEVRDRASADQLNELSNLNRMEQKAEDLFGCKRSLIFVTADQRDYLINYFRSRRSQAPKMAKEEKIAEKKNDVEQNLTELFGANGYTVVEE
ncbi:MAG: hypothetical protein IJM79_04805, partial [Erysipelotrichaceae bacterium]|nr:hypothetical protein [Erysipelotrichaceae bacterium]